jgi:hypothetical protein
MMTTDKTGHGKVQELKQAIVPSEVFHQHRGSQNASNKAELML